MTDRMMTALDACEAALFIDIIADEDNQFEVLPNSTMPLSGSGAIAAKALRTESKASNAEPKAVKWRFPSDETLSRVLTLLEECSHIELSGAPASETSKSYGRAKTARVLAPYGHERFVLELALGQKPDKDTRIRDGREVAISLPKSGLVERQDVDDVERDNDLDEEQECEDFWDDEGFSEDASAPPVRLWRVPLREIIEKGRIVSKSKPGPKEIHIGDRVDEDSASEREDDVDSERDDDREKVDDDDYDSEVFNQVLLKRPEVASSMTGMRFVLRHVEESKLERFDERLFNTFLVQDYDTCAAESLTAACNAICGEAKYSTEDVFDAFGKAAVRKLGGRSASDPALTIKKTDDKHTKRLKRMVRNYRRGGRWDATWDVGNSDIVDAAEFCLGLKATRLLDRNWMSSPPPKGSRDEATKKDEVWRMLKEHFWEGGKCNHGVLLFHLQGYETGHYTLIFGLRELHLAAGVDESGTRGRGRNRHSLRRDVFTSTYGQKPKHWMSLDRLYNMIFLSKFTGYAMIKLEPK